ncbi:Agc akt protein kinase [Globisporangium polare]
MVATVASVSVPLPPPAQQLKTQGSFVLLEAQHESDDEHDLQHELPQPPKLKASFSTGSVHVLEESPEQDGDDESDDESDDDAQRSLPLAAKKLPKTTTRQTSALVNGRGNTGKKPFRRATTIAVPLSLATQKISRRLHPHTHRHSIDSSSTNDDDSGSFTESGSPKSTARPLMRSQSFPMRAAAVQAIENGETRFRFSTAASAREIVREMYSLRLREFPEECCHNARVEMKVGGVWRHMKVELDREGIVSVRTSVFRKKRKQIRIPNDDILGATLAAADSHKLVLHYMKPGKGLRDKKLLRQYKTVEMRFTERQEAEKWAQSIQTIVKWLARVPLNCTRKIKVVVNPHSGKRRGRQIFQEWKPLFDLAGIQCDMEETQYSGHARDIAAALDLREKYEALVFVGGDGTVNEFMNGIFSREESEWRNLVATTPVSLLCAGTDNAFGLGVGTPSHEASVYCIIKRKIRPLDVITIEGDRADGTTHREYACCGISYGIGGDIAMESEKMRWLGIYRYMFLKIKRGVLAPRKHQAKLKYVLSDNIERDAATGAQNLRTYYDIADDDAQDQHHIEMCSVYDDSYANKRWNGDASSIFKPASEEKYGDQWLEEEHSYGTVGASNVYFETKYAHPSDGNMDMIIVRKGAISKQIDVALRYVVGDYLDSSLVDYFKIKAMVIEQAVPDPINVDGEVFDGPGPFRIEVVPQLLCVLSEK